MDARALVERHLGIILVRTGFDISLGNRGRVDVNVVVRGKATHSSAPEAA
jgi:acetylornithine deacetylase/succinyl-diaminopimelate desuccinylase-like protein